MTAPRTSLWQRLVNTWRHNQRKRGYAIDLVGSGFVFRERERHTEMRWEHVSRIDAGVRNCVSMDFLYVQIFTHQATVYIEELDDGFRQFEITLFERWPQIRPGWEALLKVPPREARHETLWRSDG